MDNDQNQNNNNDDAFMVNGVYTIDETTLNKPVSDNPLAQSTQGSIGGSSSVNPLTQSQEDDMQNHINTQAVQQQNPKISESQSSVIEGVIDNTAQSNSSKNIIMHVIVAILGIVLVVVIYLVFFRKDPTPEPTPDPKPVDPTPVDPTPVDPVEKDNDIGYKLTELEELASLYYKQKKGSIAPKVHAQLAGDTTVIIQLSGKSGGRDTTLELYTVDKTTTTGTNITGGNITLLNALDSVCTFSKITGNDAKELKNYCKEQLGHITIGDNPNSVYFLGKDYLNNFTQSIIKIGFVENNPATIDKGEAILAMHNLINNFKEKDKVTCYSRTFLDKVATGMFGKKMKDFAAFDKFDGKVLSNYYCINPNNPISTHAYNFIKLTEKSGAIDLEYTRDNQKLVFHYKSTGSKYVLSSISYAGASETQQPIQNVEDTSENNETSQTPEENVNLTE